MHWRSNIFSIFFIFLPAVVFAQRVNIVDKASGHVIPYVYVVMENQNLAVQSDATGMADLSLFPKKGTISIQMMGYTAMMIQLDTLKQRDYTVKLRQDDHTLDEVVVAASRSRQLQDVSTQTVRRVNSLLIQESQPQTGADVLTQSEQVYVQKSQMGGGSPMIRGFAANRVLLAVDGVRLNNAIFRSGNVHNVLSIDPYALQQADVIFGPGAVNYGSDAIGGVMAFSTLQPTFEDSTRTATKLNIASRWSSANNEKTIHADMHTATNKLAYIISFSFSDFDDLRMGRNALPLYQQPLLASRQDRVDVALPNENALLQSPTGYRQVNFMQKLAYRPSSNWKLEYGMHIANTSDIPRYDRLKLTDAQGMPQFAEWYYGPQSWMMNVINIGHTRKYLLFDQLRITAAHQKHEESRNDRRFGRNLLRSRFETVDALSLNINFEKRLADGHAFFYGMENIKNTVGSEANAFNLESGEDEPLSTRYPDGSQWASYAAFLNYKTNWSSRFSTVAGIRYSHIATTANFDNTFYNFPFTEAVLQHDALNGSIGAKWQLSKKLEWNATAASGFRAPNIDDIGKVFDSEPGNVVVPNPALQPELAYNIESGLRWDSQKLRLGATVFHTWLEGAIIRTDFAIDGNATIDYDGQLSNVQALTNASHARVYGWQADASWQLSDHLSIESHINYAKGYTIEDGLEVQPLRHIAPMFGSAFLHYSKGIARLSIFSRFNGEIQAENMPLEEKNNTHFYPLNESDQPFSPSWYTLNFRSAWQISPTLVFNAAVENITDEGYWPFAGGIAAPGRNIILALRLSL